MEFSPWSSGWWLKPVSNFVSMFFQLTISSAWKVLLRKQECKWPLHVSLTIGAGGIGIPAKGACALMGTWRTSGRQSYFPSMSEKQIWVLFKKEEEGRKYEWIDLESPWYTILSVFLPFPPTLRLVYWTCTLHGTNGHVHSMVQIDTYSHSLDTFAHMWTHA